MANEVKEAVELTPLDPPENARTYLYGDGRTLVFKDVVKFLARPSGGHRLETKDGLKHIVMPGFLGVTLDVAGDKSFTL